MADQLSIYNGALLLCGERFLSALTEEREPRRLLDHVWANGGLNTCLEMGQWNFAMRASQVDYDTNIEPDFGYVRAFVKPTDWVLSSAICTDDHFQEPLTQYIDEAGYWYADVDTLYVRYVSNDAGYGLSLTDWPDSFREYVEEYFASKIIRKLTNSDEEEASCYKRLEKKLRTAKSRAAMAEPTAFPARGAWSSSRMGGGSMRDRGNRGSLIG